MVSAILSFRLMSKSSQGIGCFIALCLLLMAGNLYAASLVSQVSRSTVSLGETLDLTVTFDQQTMFGEPDFSALNKDFKTLGSNRQSQYSNINGRTVATTQWVVTLSPKKEGTLLIPSFSFKGEISNAVEITARKPEPSRQKPGAPVFTETLLDKQSVYVQEQALLTVRLYTSISINNFAIDELTIPNAQVLKVAESKYQKTLDDQEYTVVETRYAIFTESSGTLTIPAIQYSGVVTDRNNSYSRSPFGQRGQQIYYHSEAKKLIAKAVPKNSPLSHWLPSKGISLQERWSDGVSSSVNIGEPLTRTITITGQELMGAQLPPLLMPSSKSYKLYPDQAQIEDGVSESGVQGKRIESIAIVPTQAGAITLPDITLKWWDTEADQMRETVLKGRTLEVLPAPGTNKSSADITDKKPAAQETQPSPAPGAGQTNATSNSLLWLLVGSNILLLMVASTFAYLWSRKRRSAISLEHIQSAPLLSDKAELKRIRMCAANEDYPGLRQAIIDWARKHWQSDTLHSLDQVARRADNEKLTIAFKALDTALYSGQSGQQPDAQIILTELETLRKSRPPNEQQSNKDRRHHLQSLYPN